MKLYEIDQAIIDCVDSETGEITDIEKLESLELERGAKIEGIACYIKSLRAECDALKAEEAALKERRTAKENKADSMTEWLTGILNGEKFETSKVKLSWRKSEQVNVIDEMLIPREYITEKVTTSPNKTLIKQAMKSGEQVLGCELIECNNLQIK